MSSEPAVFVGTSGYSFKDWVGPFYPRGMAPVDQLPFYASHFNCVEVNTTYYGIPKPRVLAQMAVRTPERFRFVVKLNQAITHDRATDPLLFASFLDAVQPLKDAGKYHGILAQFPWAFRRDDSSKRHLEILRERLPGETLWIEFRHSSWMHPQLPDWLRERNLGYCAVDEPAIESLVPPVTHVTNGIGYVRFHGRNAQAWWKEKPGRARSGAGTASESQVAVEPQAEAEPQATLWPVPNAAEAAGPSPRAAQPGRYNYDYSESELAEWVKKVQALSQQAKQTYLFFNNCHAGQAARNAKLMEELLRRAGSLL